MTSWPQGWRLLRREVALERSTHESLGTTPAFVLAAIVLVGLGANARTDALREVAPAIVWLLVLSAAVPLSRGVRLAEREDDCWDALRGLVSPTALLIGKTGWLWVQLAITWAVAVLLATAALSASWTAGALIAGPLGTLGLAANTVLFGVLTGSSTRSAALLGVLVLPAGLPALLAGTQTALAATSATPWLVLLAVVDVITVVTTWALMPILLEE